MADEEYWRRSRDEAYEPRDNETVPPKSAAEVAQQEAAWREGQRVWQLTHEGPEPQTPDEAAHNKERQRDLETLRDVSVRTQSGEHGIYDHLARWDSRKNARDSMGERKASDTLSERRHLVETELSALYDKKRGVNEAFDKKWNDPEPHLNPSRQNSDAFAAKVADFDAAADAFQRTLQVKPPPTISKLTDPTETFKEHVRREQIGKLPTTDAERAVYVERMRDLAEVDAKEGTPGHKEATRAFDQKWIQPERDARKAARLAAENPDRVAGVPPRAPDHQAAEVLAQPIEIINQQPEVTEDRPVDNNRNDPNGVESWVGEATPWTDPEDAEDDLDLIEAAQAVQPDNLTAEQVWGAGPAHHEDAQGATVIDAFPPRGDHRIYSDAEMLATSIPISQQNAEAPSIQAATTPATPSSKTAVQGARETPRTIRPAPPVRDQAQGVGRGRTIVAPPTRTTAQPRPAAASAPQARPAPPVRGQRITSPHPATRTTVLGPAQAPGMADRNAPASHIRPAGAPLMRATARPDHAHGRAQPIRPAGLPPKDAAAAAKPPASPFSAMIDSAKTAPQSANQQQTQALAASR
jgi:hypothetical protein